MLRFVKADRSLKFQRLTESARQIRRRWAEQKIFAVCAQALQIAIIVRNDLFYFSNCTFEFWTKLAPVTVSVKAKPNPPRIVLFGDIPCAAGAKS